MTLDLKGYDEGCWPVEADYLKLLDLANSLEVGVTKYEGTNGKSRQRGKYDTKVQTEKAAREGYTTTQPGINSETTVVESVRLSM